MREKEMRSDSIAERFWVVLYIWGLGIGVR